MLKTSHVPVKPVVRKDRSKESSFEENGDLKPTSNLPVASTEEELLALESRIQRLVNGNRTPVNAIDQGSVGDNESSISEKYNTPVFNEKNTGNKSVFSELLIEKAGIPLSLESNNSVSIAQKLTQDEMTMTLSLVEELQHNVPLLIERRDQTTFEPVGDSPLAEHAAHFLSVVELDTSELNTNDEKLQLTRARETEGIQSIVEEREFVVPELIAKVVSMAAASWSYTGLKLNESTVMLLTNGMAYTSLTGPPGDIVLPKNIAEADSEWTTWRQDESGVIYLAGGAGESRLIGEEIDLTPLKNEDIAGLHASTTAAIYGATMVTSWSDFMFRLDGTFERSSSVLTTTGGAGTMLMDNFTSSFHQQTARGGNNVVGTKSDYLGVGDVVALGADSVIEYPNTHLFGTYSLLGDGLTIEMQYANGVIERRLIYKGKDYLHFGGSAYKTQLANEHYFDSLQEFALRLEKGKRVVWLSLLADSILAGSRKYPTGSVQQTANSKDSLKNLPGA